MKKIYWSFFHFDMFEDKIAGSFYATACTIRCWHIIILIPSTHQVVCFKGFFMRVLGLAWNLAKSLLWLTSGTELPAHIWNKWSNDMHDGWLLIHHVLCHVLCLLIKIQELLLVHRPYLQGNHFRSDLPLQECSCPGQSRKSKHW
jgi:hypothetical protein